MLAPIRDYLGPQDPKSSPLLCAIKDHYFTRLSVFVDPSRPGFGEARWIVSEDVNVEHLLDVFTSIDTSSGDFWDACCNFMQHILWHKPRQTVLGPKIEDLPDDHPSKPKCLFRLSRLLQLIANHQEEKRLLTHALKLQRDRRGGDGFVAEILRRLSEANRFLDLPKEGMQRAREALEFSERLGDAFEQALSLDCLAWLLFDLGQFDAAEAAAFRILDLVPEKGQEYLVCRSHRLLGNIHWSKEGKEKAVHHLETAIAIASPFNWHREIFWNYYTLVQLCVKERKFDQANAQIERAKPHAMDDTYMLARLMEVQADVWYRERKLERARTEVLRAQEIY